MEGAPVALVHDLSVDLSVIYLKQLSFKGIWATKSWKQNKRRQPHFPPS